MSDLAHPGVEDLANQAISKAGVGPFFWSTIWVPYASYLWTLGWFAEGIIKQAAGKSDSKITLFDKWEKIVMVLADFLWFFATAILIALIAEMICHGTGLTGGAVTGWVARFVIKVTTLGQVNFDFCKDIPPIQ